MIKYAWLTGCKTDEEKASRTSLVANSVQIFTLLSNILSRKAEDVDRRSLQEEDYEKPELVARLAFRNGKIAAYREIYDLLQTKGDST